MEDCHCFEGRIPDPCLSTVDLKKCDAAEHEKKCNMIDQLIATRSEQVVKRRKQVQNTTNPQHHSLHRSG